MSHPELPAACDRLATIFARALALQERTRPATDDSVRTPVEPFVIALLRMRVRPALGPGWPEGDPVHVVMLGGTNSGKSTVLNLLLGAAGAAMGVRARLSQHPEAFRPPALGDGWLDAFPSRFAGYRRYRDRHPPRQTDEELRRDGYRPALAVLDPDGATTATLATAATAVFWDAPDFSTEEAQIYLGTVLELAALADVVVLAVTDESYADDRGTRLARMVRAAGVALVVAANKLPESRTLLDDIVRTLGADGDGDAVAIHRLPQVAGANPEQRLRNLLASAEGAALRATIAREVARGADLKRQGFRGALGFIERHWEDVLRPLAAEAEVAALWGRTVEQMTRERIVEPYRRDYLEGAGYGEFHQALILLMGLLQVPGIGTALDLIGGVVRAPVRLAAGWLRRRPGAAGVAARPPAEHEVLVALIPPWLAALRAEAQAHATPEAHAAWADVACRLGNEATVHSARERLAAAFEGYRRRVDAEVRRRAEALGNTLRERPRRLAVLRAANLLAGALVVGVVVGAGGLTGSDAVLGPVVAGLWHNLLEWGLGRYLETQKAGLKQEHLRALHDLVATHLERPVRELFATAVGADDLAEARRDFARIREAADGSAGGPRR
ncbi:MAG TPA: hypothetical protein VF590_15140 [Isosphaeraceae bacterium]